MRPSRVVPVLVVPVAAVLLLTGCGWGAKTDVTASPSATRAASPSASASGSPSPSASAPSAAPGPAASATPVSIPCSSVVSDQTVYNFNPIYGAKSPATIVAGTAAARVSADRGTVCQWINTTSGATITVSIGKYDAAGIAALKSSVSGGTAVAGWGDAGWFAEVGPDGVGSAFTGAFWITVQGAEIGSSGDAGPFVTSAVAAAKAKG